LPQFTLLNDDAKKRVLFMSDFGTGKTSLLRAKAKQLLAKSEQVIIISIEDRESSTESILTIQLRAEFKDQEKATVMSLKGTGIRYVIKTYYEIIFQSIFYSEGF
jgi:type II secretory pathway predicted ATPase ExeA